MSQTESKGWELVSHVRPIGDLVEHGWSHDCICGPSVEEHHMGDGDINYVIVHHSLDGREEHEPDYQPPEPLV